MENYQIALNWEFKEEFKEKDHGKSVTVPDMSYTVKELLDKFTKGFPVDLYKNENYMDFEVEFSDMELNEVLFTSAPDLVDLQQAQEYIKDLKATVSQKLKDLQDANIKGLIPPKEIETV